MLTSLGLKTIQRAARVARRTTTARRTVTTRTSITDHATGATIRLTDPSNPQNADYPHVTPTYAQHRDPLATYDFQQMRRNKNDPLTLDDDLYDMWSPEYYLTVDDKTALKHNGIFFALVFGVAALVGVAELNPEKPAMPRSYPYNGLAKSLGSGDAATDYFYRVRPDADAAAAGVLADDDSAAAQQEACKKAHPDFFQA